MTEKIVFETEVKTKNSQQSVASVKAELRQLKQELAGLDPSGAEFAKLATRAGQLEDKIQDVNNAVKAFNPEAKFQAFAAVLGGVANGLSAVQGSMALFGAESKEVEKMILRTQGAMALATGINGLLGMKDAFIVLSNVIKTQVVTAFSSLGKAIKSTGIIALAASLAVLVYEMYQAAKATEKFKKEQEQLNAFSEKSKDLALEGMRGRAREREAVKRQMNKDLADIDEAVKETTYNTEQGEKLKQQIRENAGKALAELNAKFRKEDRDKEIEATIKNGEEVIALKKLLSKDNLQILEEQYKAEKKLLDYKLDNQRVTEQEYLTQSLANQQNYEAAKLAIEQAAFNQRMSNISTVADATSALANLIGAQTEAGKGLAVAAATIDTYVGANKALAASPPPFNYIAAGAVIATGLMNVQRILSTDVPKTNFAGGGGAGISGGAASAPPPPPILPPSSNITQLTGSNGPLLTRVLNVEDQRVYVVSYDMTQAQSRDNKIKRRAKVK